MHGRVHAMEYLFGEISYFFLIKWFMFDVNGWKVLIEGCYCTQN
jgi:hypothetical protein